MQLHELRREHKQKRKKRIGRGGKKGTYSGRGIKGQKSRSGSTPRPVLRDIVKKFPKQRGYRFNPIKPKPKVVNLLLLEKKFNNGDKVSLATLRKKQLIRQTDFLVKILGVGELTKKLNFSGSSLSFSASAREKIKKSGGKISTPKIVKPTLPKKERPKKKSSKAPAKPGQKEESSSKKPAAKPAKKSSVKKTTTAKKTKPAAKGKAKK